MKRKAVVGIVIAVIIVGALGIGTKQFIKYRTEQKAAKLFEEQTVPKVVTDKQLNYLEGYYTTTKAFNKEAEVDLSKTTKIKEDNSADNKSTSNESSSDTSSNANVEKVTEREPNINGIDILKDKVVVLKDGKEIYKTTDKIYARVIKADEFKEIFGVNPADLGLGLNQKEFVVYKVGNINIFKLAEGDLLFTYDGVLNYGLDDTVVAYPNQVSYWYGNFQVTDKVGEPKVIDNAKNKNLTGDEIVINKEEFKYGDKIIKDPQYYVFEESPEALYNKADYKGTIAQDGDKVFFLGVLPKEDKLTRIEKYMATKPGYESKAITPIILKSNGEVEVMNGAKVTFNTKRVLPTGTNK